MYVSSQKKLKLHITASSSGKENVHTRRGLREDNNPYKFFCASRLFSMLYYYFVNRSTKPKERKVRIEWTEAETKVYVTFTYH